MAQIGRFCRQFIGNVQIQANAGLMGNGRQVQHRVCGTAKGHIHSQRIEKRFLCHNVSGFYILFYQFHNLHTRMFCQADTFGIHGGDGSIAPKAHAQGFR